MTLGRPVPEGMKNALGAGGVSRNDMALVRAYRQEAAEAAASAALPVVWEENDKEQMLFFEAEEIAGPQSSAEGWEHYTQGNGALLMLEEDFEDFQDAEEAPQAAAAWGSYVAGQASDETPAALPERTRVIAARGVATRWVQLRRETRAFQKANGLSKAGRPKINLLGAFAHAEAAALREPSQEIAPEEEHARAVGSESST